MYDYSITYGVYEKERIIKTGTIGLRLEQPSSPELLLKYLQEELSWMQPGFDVRIFNWKEISPLEYERLFLNKMPEDLP